MKNDLSKMDLYEAVKVLVEAQAPHLHLCQQKLFTLFSIGFQYILFSSTKNPGHYIIRIEDSRLAEKLSKKAKDETTRRFFEKLLLPRRLKYGESTFHLDYFHLGTWYQTNDLPKDKVKGALIVKNTVIAPLKESMLTLEDETGMEEDEQTVFNKLALSPEDDHLYLTSLQSFVPRTITIAFDTDLPEVTPIKFPFIKEEIRPASGVRIASHVKWEED